MDNNKKVLIVDDDEFLLDMYTVKFKESGFEVEIAENGKDALDKIKKDGLSNAILLDIVMPALDGFGFLTELKNMGSIDKANVIVLTNLGQKEDVEKGMSLEAKDYIIKANHTPTEVVEKVNRLLHK